MSTDPPPAPPAASAAAPVDDKRAHRRLRVELPVTLREAGGLTRGAIRFDTRDLSLGGAFLRSDLLLEIGEELEVEFELPAGARIGARARVVHVVRDPAEAAGMGIAFSRMSAEHAEAVRAYLEQT